MVELITEQFQAQSLQDQLEPSQSLTQIWSIPPISPTAFQITGRRVSDCSQKGAFSEFRRTKTPQRSLETPTFSKHQRKTSCPQCREISPVPPTKRQCRSRSIPGGRWTSPCQHLPYAHLHRPVAVRPYLNNNKHLKNRNSPLACHRRVMSPGSALRSSSEFSSPPESPVPRPASVSSGYYDSSLSSLGAPWLESSPQHCSNTYNRSLSLEEAITHHAPLVTGLIPVMSGSSDNVINTPSSPRRHHIPRCRSQPCVLFDRKCSLKRRREEDRPTIDFQKMAETAYMTHTKDRPRRPKSVNMSLPQDIRFSKNFAGLFSCSLKTITGSPLDNSIPNTVVLSPQASPTKEEEEDMIDSGCSESGDPPKIVEFRGITQQNCECDSSGENLFPIDMATELDLEQIEND